jgi:uncharacterized damage-inducible protein DinB
MSNATANSSLIQMGFNTLDFGRGFTMNLLEATPDDAFLAVPCEGGNHPAWIVGHIAATDDAFVSALSGGKPSLPESWDKLFGYKSEVVCDASVYPSRAELTEALGSTRTILKTWLETLSDEQLLEPIEGDLSQFAKDRAMLMGTIAWHEGLHAGQLGVVRRSLGMPPLF